MCVKSSDQWHHLNIWQIGVDQLELKIGLNYSTDSIL
jgi:hypothetical protein